MAGATITLDCAAAGRPRPTITWLKDGATVDLAHLDSRFSLLGAGSLRIENLDVQDEGVYQCRATNSEDSVDAAAALDVEAPPKVVRGPADTVADVKADAGMECVVEGTPTPVVQWYKNGDLIIESEYFQVS